MEKIGQQFAANIRTNDLAFRYDTTTIAIILGETAEKEAMMAIEKLRKIIAGVRFPRKEGSDKGHAMEFSAGLAEAVVKESYDPVDIVTEVINRAEHALATRWRRGMGRLWRWARRWPRGPWRRRIEPLSHRVIEPLSHSVVDSINLEFECFHPLRSGILDSTLLPKENRLDQKNILNSRPRRLPGLA
jgi:hypothetical protein